MIGHRVRAFLQGLARGQTGVQVSKLGFRETRCDTGFKLVKVPVLQRIMNLLTSPNPSTDPGLHGLEEPRHGVARRPPATVIARQSRNCRRNCLGSLQAG
jgi:hypothetical protein